jgi:NAD-dependent dihydropyrimidine dehydrogenase PreA subunit
MPHVITQACCSDGSCVYACPVNCIHPSPDEPDFAAAEMLYIDPDACVDCGACEDHCHVHTPLPEALRAARVALGWTAPPRPLRPIDGDGDGVWVAVVTDDRPWPAALARRLGDGVAVWSTDDHLSVASAGHPDFPAHLVRLREQAGGRRVVVADGGAAMALGEAGVAFVWLHEHLGWEAVTSCRCGDRAACCGAAEPLRSTHPADAERMGRRWWADRAGAPVADARCAAHLRGLGLAVDDTIDRLLGGAT